MKPALPDLPELADELTNIVEAADEIYDAETGDEGEGAAGETLGGA